MNEPQALTAQEVRVVRLAARGCTNWEIGVLLGVSEHTVRGYLEHVQDKVTLDPMRDQRWLVRLAWQLAQLECQRERVVA